MGYLTNFIVYTLAMVGVIGIALMAFKMSSNTGSKSGSKFLRVQDTLSIGPRKTLYIISAGNEKFLIAGDVDKTTLISKLESNSETKITVDLNKTEEKFSTQSFEDVLRIPNKPNYIDKKGVGINIQENKPYNSVMKNLAERIRS